LLGEPHLMILQSVHNLRLAFHTADAAEFDKTLFDCSADRLNKAALADR
jgi:hypothetical protein